MATETTFVVQVLMIMLISKRIKWNQVIIIIHLDKICNDCRLQKNKVIHFKIQSILELCLQHKSPEIEQSKE